MVEEKLERAAEIERKEKCCERETEREREEESSGERERRPKQKSPPMVAAPAVHGAGERTKTLAMVALVRSR